MAITRLIISRFSRPLFITFTRSPSFNPSRSSRAHQLAPLYSDFAWPGVKLWRNLSLVVFLLHATPQPVQQIAVCCQKPWRQLDFNATGTVKLECGPKVKMDIPRRGKERSFRRTIGCRIKLFGFVQN
jgi:hypothetical protein